MRQVGSGDFIYQETRHWATLPDGWTAEDAPAVAVDSQDRVWVLTRCRNGLLAFDSSGGCLKAIDLGFCKRPHGLCLGPDDVITVVDDQGHAVHRLDTEGRLLMTLETGSNPTETGYVPGRLDSVQQSGPPFNQPTAAAPSADGGFYVADGYGNAQVHKFDAQGNLQFSWGSPGKDAGQFVTVHGIWVDHTGLVYVSDRMNARIQVFSPQGELRAIWDDVFYPDALCVAASGHVYVAELGSTYLGHLVEHLALGTQPARITVRDMQGGILVEWSETDGPDGGRYFSPHGIACDSRGDLYLSETPATYTLGQAPRDWGLVRKYHRV